MEREFMTTGDGSMTIRLPQWNEQYHSHHGAITEAGHVFIESGLLALTGAGDKKEIRVLEVGFGTGLNALMSLITAELRDLKLYYHGLEAYPIREKEWDALNFSERLKADPALYTSMHQADWDRDVELGSNMVLRKQQVLLDEFVPSDIYDLIYFDAFGPRVQPEMWTPGVFSMLYKATAHGGILVTYSAKGDVRRAMQAAGYTVERLPGPPGKREMLRAMRSD